MILENYTSQQALLPPSGKRIIAQYGADWITVYQAFNHHIADYALEHQQFGGPHYSFNRMTWIKPGFMWMMYRAGWAQKENQERILAIQLKMEGFLSLLRQAVHSSYQAHLYPTREDWSEQLAQSSVRLQWDPDHDPQGGKLNRKAIQLGIRGTTLEQFNTAYITSITDCTDFVKEQRTNREQQLQVPQERVLPLDQYPAIQQRLGADKDPTATS